MSMPCLQLGLLPPSSHEKLGYTALKADLLKMNSDKQDRRVDFFFVL